MNPARMLALAVLTILSACQSKEAPRPPSGEAPPAAPVAWSVTPEGYGPIHAGMTLAEAAAAGGKAFGAPLTGSSEECGYVYFAGDSAGSPVSFLTAHDRIARVNIEDSTIGTREGARIGDPEQRILELYPGLTVQPHKYTDGHYLVVGESTPPDSGLRIIFETDGSRVTRYRAGRMPEVGYVEGCS